MYIARTGRQRLFDGTCVEFSNLLLYRFLYQNPDLDEATDVRRNRYWLAARWRRNYYRLQCKIVINETPATMQPPSYARV